MLIKLTAANLAQQKVCKRLIDFEVSYTISIVPNVVLVHLNY